MKSFTEKTITRAEALKQELARVRSEHLARDREEYILKDNCNAAPICNSQGKIIAAISLTAFETYMSVEEIEAAIPALQNTARRVSALAGYQNGML